MHCSVLLIHGIYDTEIIFRKMREELEAHGIYKVDAMNIAPSDASIPFEKMADQVSVAVDQCMRKTKTAQIDIVAYSMGAIAARYYLQSRNGRSPIRKYISIAGPHHGSFTAYLGWDIGARQLRPHSPFMEWLNRDEGEWGSVEMYSIWSPWDLMVLPAHSSVLKQAINLPVHVLFHNLLVSNRGVIREVIAILKKDHGLSGPSH
jgi:triacylglycerol lipase